MSRLSSVGIKLIGIVGNLLALIWIIGGILTVIIMTYGIWKESGYSGVLGVLAEPETYGYLFGFVLNMSIGIGL